MRIKPFYYYFILITFLVLSGCEGPQGEPGPIGPQGQQGAQGIQGEPGNANIISKTVTLTPDDWTIDGNLAVIYISDADLTEDIANTGVVLVYFQFMRYPRLWDVMPYTKIGDVIISFGYSEGEIGVSYHKPEPIFGDIPINKIKYVLIPSSESLNGRLASMDYSKMSHDEVMALLGIPN
jgi:hypothetical protein